MQALLRTLIRSILIILVCSLAVPRCDKGPSYAVTGIVSDDQGRPASSAEVAISFTLVNQVTGTLVPSPLRHHRRTFFGTDLTIGSEWTLSIMDSHGKLVRRMSPDPIYGEKRFLSWDGVDRGTESAPDGFYYYEIVGDRYFERSFFYHARRGFFADSKGRYSIEWNDLPIGESVQYEDRYGMSLGIFRVTKQVRLCGGAFGRAIVGTSGWEEVACRLVDLRSGSTIEVNLGGPG